MLRLMLVLISLIIPAKAHDIYSTWKRPRDGGSCCSDQDCYATAARFIHGFWYAIRREDKAWIQIPPEVILHDQRSPDGLAHLCAPPPYLKEFGLNTVYCFVEPTMGY